MEDHSNNKTVHNIVSEVLESPVFKTLISEVVSNFNTTQPQNVRTTSLQHTQTNQISQNMLSTKNVLTGTQEHGLSTSLSSGRLLGHGSSEGCSSNSSTPSLIHNLKTLFPSIRGKVPTFSKSKRKVHSSTFYRDVILLTNPNAICTLKGAKKSEAYIAGLAKSDLKFDCVWNKEQILKYLKEQFSAYLQDTFEILLPESGRLIKIDETQEPIDGYKLKRLFQNRKVIYLRPFSHLETSNVFNSSSSLLTTTLENVVSNDNIDNSMNEAYDERNLIDDEENVVDEEEIAFQQDLRIAYERSLENVGKGNLEENLEEVTIESLLRKVSNNVKEDSTTIFNIYRKEVFASCMRATLRKKFDPFAKISVTFTDNFENSESAVDAGGPSREMFRLLLKELESGLLFEGRGKKYISLNSKCLEKNEYYEAGKLIALSIVHVGQGPTFFSDLLFSIIVNGIEGSKPTEEFIDENTLQKLHQLRNINNLEKLQDLIVNESLFTYAGIHFIYTLEEKEEVIARTLKFYCFYRVKAAIDQFVEGLKTCEIRDLMTKHPDLFYPLMCTDPQLTSQIILDLFEVSHHPVGSNYREVENKIVGYWRDYVLDCEEVEINEGVTLEEILIFTTGARNISSLGFQLKPTIHFLHTLKNSVQDPISSEERVKGFPEANTCALELHLPVNHTTYSTFKEDMDYAIVHCKDFGKV